MNMDHTLLRMEISKDLFSMKPRNEMDYVFLSNLYRSTGQWKEAGRVRMDMAGKGVKKPGCSWIEVLNTVVVSVAGDLSHVWTADIHSTLAFLEHEMRNPSLDGMKAVNLTFFQIFVILYRGFSPMSLPYITT